MRLLLLAAVFALPVTAQQPSSSSTPPTRPPAPTGRITGAVTCADTHRPARGAIVVATPIGGGAEDNRGSGTNSAQLDGTYTIDHLLPGTYFVIAYMPGYSLPFDDDTLNQIRSNDPELQMRLRRYGVAEIAGKEPAHFDISLVRGAAVNGRVLYSDGSPASQVSIQIEDTKHEINYGVTVGIEVVANSMTRSVYRHQSFNTDDQGRFRISGLSPGEYRIAAVQPPSQGVDVSPEMLPMLSISGFVTDAYPLRIYSGDTMHKSSAKKYQLRAGDEVSGIDITIPLDALHHVQGLLHAIDGRPLNEASLTLIDTSDSSLQFYAKLHRDGTFDFQLVPSGTYRLEINNAGIGLPPKGLEDEPHIVLRITNTFSATTTTILVKDSDITDIDVPMKEVPLAK